ncbi:MAG: alpha/beta hydrolase, partial [Proteobacteria bacterium]|nr:alpha/beta hydrolase [Pseudomonadota bacterium]
MIAVPRRSVLAGMGLALPASVAAGQSGLSPAAGVIRLWPKGVPGAPSPLPRQQSTPRGTDPRDRVVTGVADPTLTVHRSAQPNGAALVVAQGGGYVRIAQTGSVPDYFTRNGYTVFELLYRLPTDGWAAGPEAPLQDVQRALRVVRADAPRWGVDPARVGVLGFSAGGHVASGAATRFATRTYGSSDVLDEAEALSARPDFAVLVCPVITMQTGRAHGGS